MIKKPLAPIALFTYNRPDHTRQTLEALSANPLASESILYIFCDGPKPGCGPEELSRIRAVRQLSRVFPWPGELHVIERKINAGLAESIIGGVTDILERHNEIIVLEDDILTSPAFLGYMNFALRHFSDYEVVGSVNSWMLNIPPRLLPKYFFLYGGDCWGWGTWKRSWDLLERDSGKLLDIISQDSAIKGRFNWKWMSILTAQAEGKISSWHIRWHSSLIVNNKLGLFPGRSYIRNIGNDNSGTHNTSASQDSYTHRLNANIDEEYISRLNLVPNRYAKSLIEFDRKYQAVRSHASGFLKYRLGKFIK